MTATPDIRLTDSEIAFLSLVVDRPPPTLVVTEETSGCEPSEDGARSLLARRLIDVDASGSVSVDDRIVRLLDSIFSPTWVIRLLRLAEEEPTQLGHLMGSDSTVVSHQPVASGVHEFRQMEEIDLSAFLIDTLDLVADSSTDSGRIERVISDIPAALDGAHDMAFDGGAVTRTIEYGASTEPESASLIWVTEPGGPWVIETNGGEVRAVPVNHATLRDAILDIVAIVHKVPAP